MKFIRLLIIIFIAAGYESCYAGRIVTDGFVSKFVGVSPDNPNPTDCKRLFNVYLPDAFDANPHESFPIVYHLTGFGGDYTTYSESDKFYMDQMLKDGQIVPLIIIFPDPRDLTFVDNYYTNSILNGQFESYFIQELIPYVDEHYRQKKNAQGDASVYRAIMGHSMGGYGSLFYGIKYSDLFIAYASDSGTPFWTITSTIANPPTTGTPPVPTNNMYSFTKLFTEIAPLPPDGTIAPTNNPVGLYSLFYAWASAFSPAQAGQIAPCVIETEPCTENPPYCVNYPFVVNADSTVPRDADGRFIAQQNIVDQWNSFDPYFILQNKINQDPANLVRFRRQATYLDAGINPQLDIIANVGARYFSDRLTSFNINNEYILFDAAKGGHTDCTTLPEAPCYRFETNLKIFSGKFSQAGVFVPEVRTRIFGDMSIVLNDNSVMEILNKNVTAIETAPDRGVTATNVTIRILDSAQLTIGTEEVLGGGLQVGNSFGKANLLFDPSLVTNTIAFNLELNGPGAVLRIGKQGFLGFGIGIQGNQTAVPNYWGLSTLTNVANVQLNLLQGHFFHDQIASSLDPKGALFGIGASLRYGLTLNQETATISGGGNLATMGQANLIHPTVHDTAGFVNPGGIRPETVIVPNPNELFDTFYGPPNGFMGSTTFYLNDMTVGILSSSQMLADRSKPPLPTDASRVEFFDFLNANEYLVQEVKRAPITDLEGKLTIDYLTPIPKDAEHQAINRVVIDRAAKCSPLSKPFNEQKIVNEGAVGIKLATVDGKTTILRLYDLDPDV